MSTLTKILIVLLTVSSLFLCGIVVTYVANADDYKQKYDDQRDDIRASKDKAKKLTKQIKEKSDEMDRSKKKLNSSVSSLKTEVRTLKGKIQDLESEKAALSEKVNSWASITKDFYETNDKQGQLLKNTLGELDVLQAKQIKQKKELDETTSILRERMAIIETLESENDRLLEERSELQNRLGKGLLPFGKEPARATAVTPRRGPSRRTATREALATRDIALHGLVTAVDLRNSMASVSIGSADGVKSGMKFHITRRDDFICDILIIDVDSEESVGILELIQQNPRIGDNASTNLNF